jgi:hypothetical protein
VAQQQRFNGRLRHAVQQHRGGVRFDFDVQQTQMFQGAGSIKTFCNSSNSCWEKQKHNKQKTNIYAR